MSDKAKLYWFCGTYGFFMGALLAISQNLARIATALEHLQR